MVSISNIMNDRPAGVRFLSDDYYVPVTLNQLLIGWTSTNVESLNVAETVKDMISLIRRMRYISELETVW